MKFKLLLTVLLLSFATPVMAQPVELNLKLSPAEADLVWKGLRKLPVEEVENLLLKIRQQVADQIQPKPAPKPTEEPKKE